MSGATFPLHLLSATGWLALALVGGTTVLPYLARSAKLRTALGLPTGQRVPLLERMRTHMYLGYLIAAFAVLHAGVAMSLPLPGLLRLNQAGLTVASVSLILVLMQTIGGALLAQRAGADRRQLRRWHFLAMCAIIVTAVVHVALNGPASGMAGP